jgi:hypothetical protein
MKVVMTNAMKRPTWLLAETCSWGYEMLAFEIMDPEMHHYRVIPKPRGWDKNVPTPVLVGPGKSTFRTVSLGNGTWVGLPAGISGKASGWKIRANLNVARDRTLVGWKLKGSALPGFWFGKSVSPWIALAW